MTEEQEERLVNAWEGIAQNLGVFSEILKSAISKQWPDTRETRPATVTRVPTAEERLKKETGNTDGSVTEWLGEFDPEEEIGPREKAFLARQAKKSSRT